MRMYATSAFELVATHCSRHRRAGYRHRAIYFYSFPHFSFFHRRRVLLRISTSTRSSSSFRPAFFQTFSSFSSTYKLLLETRAHTRTNRYVHADGVCMRISISLSSSQFEARTFHFACCFVFSRHAAPCCFRCALRFSYLFRHSARDVNLLNCYSTRDSRRCAKLIL